MPHKTLSLRPYQVAATQQIQAAQQAGQKRIILCMPTGAGKTETAVDLIQQARAQGKSVAFVADRRVLVRQTSQRLHDYGIMHGIAMANDTIGRQLPVQVCSAQTLEQRGYWPDLGLLILDEAHHQRKSILRFAAAWGGDVIGLTATPLTPGLGEFYDGIINAVTTDQLRQDGYLAPLRIFVAEEIDMAGAAKTAGEWQASAVRERGHKIIGDLPTEWAARTKAHFGGPVKTLVFSADVAHGADICRAFQLAGYDFRQTSYQDSDAETERLVAGFAAGDYPGLVSVAKLTKGFDQPDVLCGIDARPNSGSLTEVLQKMGRVMRVAPGKEYGLWLDHAGNMAGWYEDVLDFWAEGVASLDDSAKDDPPKRKEGSERVDTICPCGYVLLPAMAECPACGATRRAKRTQAEVIPGEMRELTAPGSRRWREDRRWVWQQIIKIACLRKPDPQLAKKYALAQYRNMYQEWPPREWGFQQKRKSEPADPRVERAVNRQVKAWVRSKAKR